MAPKKLSKKARKVELKDIETTKGGKGGSFSLSSGGTSYTSIGTASVDDTKLAPASSFTVKL
jgi:hypothetical protein